MKSKDRMFFVDSGVCLRMMGNVLSLSAGQTIRQTKNDLEIQTGNGIVRSTKEANAYIQDLDTHLYAKLVEDSPSLLSLGRVCDELGCSFSWQPGGNLTPTKGKTVITCCTVNFVPFVAVTQQKAIPFIWHDPDMRNPVQEKKVGETMFALLELFSESLIDDDAVSVSKITSCRQRSQA